jgi:UDP-glucose 4-epimerase
MHEKINTPVLVTGGAGYIGSHTVRLLAAQGRKIVVLDNLVMLSEKFDHLLQIKKLKKTKTSNLTTILKVDQFPLNLLALVKKVLTILWKKVHWPLSH